MNTVRVFDHEKLNVYHESLTFVGHVSMLVGLIKSVAPDRVYEEPADYLATLPLQQVKVKEQTQSKKRNGKSGR